MHWILCAHIEHMVAGTISFASLLVPTHRTLRRTRRRTRYVRGTHIICASGLLCEKFNVEIILATLVIICVCVCVLFEYYCACACAHIRFGVLGECYGTAGFSSCCWYAYANIRVAWASPLPRQYAIRRDEGDKANMRMASRGKANLLMRCHIVYISAPFTFALIHRMAHSMVLFDL